MKKISSESGSDSLPPDNLNAQMGVLTRREVEARILSPIIEALSEEFDRASVVRVVRDTIVRVAQEQGAELAQAMGGDSSHHFADSLEYWTHNNALEIDVLEHSDETLSFNVTGCRYAELYRALGIPELGAVLSCNRDYALIDGFNGDASLIRTQTIMQGASHCDFRYTFEPIQAENIQVV
ncbi:MAG: L-2-amino-thiazoline-4-carboxylic acid hydrolase [Ardenticatenaceae bacterium]